MVRGHGRTDSIAEQKAWMYRGAMAKTERNRQNIIDEGASAEHLTAA